MGPDQDQVSPLVNENIDSIATFHRTEERKLRASERFLAHVSGVIGHPGYLIAVLVFIGLWIVASLAASWLGLAPWDPPPFGGLQALLTIAAVATSTIVLITQQRHARLESRRAHLDLQVNLLTEQKVTKLIILIEELRRDLPNVHDRDDPEATALQVRTDTALVLSALANAGIGTGAPVDPET